VVDDYLIDDSLNAQIRLIHTEKSLHLLFFSKKWSNIINFAHLIVVVCTNCAAFHILYFIFYI